MAAASGSSFWPSGAIVLVVITVVVVSIGIWRSRNAKKSE